MNIKEVEQYLRANKYLFEFQGKMFITSKFIRDLKKEEVVVIGNPSLLPVLSSNSGIAVVEVIETPKERFKRFIAEAEVPYRVTGSNGKSYTCNAYNVVAERVFNKALKEGYDWRGLVMSTKLYYKGTGYKQKISNYFILGTWESEYDELVKKLTEGNVEQHINNQIRPSTGERKMI